MNLHGDGKRMTRYLKAVRKLTKDYIKEDRKLMQDYMKAEPKRKLHRNKLLTEYRFSHPELSLRDIGRMFNISKQRCAIIIKAELQSGNSN